MFAANDVVYLMRRVRIAFMKKAILTAKGGAFCDESPKRLAYVTGQAACVAVPEPSARRRKTIILARLPHGKIKKRRTFYANHGESPRLPLPEDGSTGSFAR